MMIHTNTSSAEDDPLYTDWGPLQIPTSDIAGLYITDHESYYRKYADAQMRAQGVRQHASVAQAFEDCAGIAELKQIGCAPHETLARFERLKAAFPNFDAFLNQIQGACCRALLRSVPGISDIKILLLGPPGIGKTRVIDAVARELELDCERLNMNSQVTSFELKGLGAMWSTPYPGAVARAFAHARHANPILLLDEVDKGCVHRRQFGSALDALLELAEPSTARRWRDECLGIQFDASGALLIATANDTDNLSEALLSRFTVIDVAAPSPSQMPQVLATIYQDMISIDEGIYAPTLSSDIILALSKDTPRSARLRLNRAIQNAAVRTLATRHHKSDMVTLTVADLPEGRAIPERFIGFVPNS